MIAALRVWWLTVVAATMFAVAVVAVPELRVGIDSGRARVALETAQSLIAALTALLLFGRYRRTSRSADLVVAGALFLTAATNLLLELVGESDRGPDPLTFTTWCALGSRVIAASLLAWAALQPGLRLPPIRRPAFALWLAVTWTLGALAGTCWLLVDRLPRGTDVLIIDGRLDPTITDRASIVTAEVIVVVLYAAASVGFARQITRRGDPLVESLAVGCALASASWAIFVYYPTIFTEIVQPGDLLRLLFYGVLAYGAEREIHAYWTRTVHETASEERRRLARELHDGLAQELAFLSRGTRLVARGEGPPGIEEMLVSASDRALDEARRAVSTLTTRGDEPLGTAIEAAAEDVASRVGTRVHVDVDPTVELTGLAREAILRIVREAVGNAGRHGGATTVFVGLGQDRVLRIADDGTGFDVDAAARPGGFGLTSMRERAEGLGGSFALRSTPGSGTIVEVTLPDA